MLFDSSVRKEVARTFGATLVVILTIVLTMFLIRTIGQAASGAVAPRDVVLLLGYIALGHLPTMLALSLFVAVVVTLGRMYRDSEMVIWFASGLDLSRFVRPVLQTFWPVLLVVCLLQAFAWPWVNRNSAELRDRYAQRSDLARVSPGVFQSSADGRRVFFVEREGSDEVSVRNIFTLSSKGKTDTVVSARNGRLEVVGDERFIVLESGQRSDVDEASGESTLAGFESYRALVNIKALRRAQQQPPKSIDTLELVRQPTLRNQGELAWRIGLMLTAINLSLLAVGLSHVNLRRPSNWNLILALLGSLAYFNAVNVTQAWVGSGRVAMISSLLVLHGGVFLLALALLWWRDHAAVLHFRVGRRRGAST